MPSRLSRSFILAASLGLLLPTAASAQSLFGQEITVYKTPTCGCCGAWADYMKAEGFKVETIDLADVDPIRAQHGLTDPSLKSCHTTIVDGYVVEGHVPADDVRRLLSERPEIVGLTAPGMPTYSPGMASEEPQGYDVLSFDAEGNSEVFSSY